MNENQDDLKRIQLMRLIENESKRNGGETVGGMFGGALGGTLTTAAGAALPMLFSKLTGNPMPAMNLKNIGTALGVGALSGAGMGALTGGGFAQGIDTGMGGGLGLPMNFVQAKRARKANALDAVYDELQKGY